MTPKELRASSAAEWKSRLGGLRGGGADDADPRVRQARTALAYHRSAKATGELVADRMMDANFARQHLDNLAAYLCDPRTSAKVGGYITEPESVTL